MRKIFASLFLSSMLLGCVPPGEIARPELPSLAYTRGLHQGRFQGTALPEQSANGQAVPIVDPATGRAQPNIPTVREAYDPGARARYHFTKDMPPEEHGQFQDPAAAIDEARAQVDQRFAGGMVSNMHAEPTHHSAHSGHSVQQPAYHVSRSTNPHVRPYQGPLHIGEPGASSSLWRAHGEGSRLFRDHRAFQAMDLITIVVSENAEGTKEADTETTKESSFLAGISELFNFTDSIEASNPGLDTATLLDADFNSEFTGEGETTRSGSLQARIAAVVVEVLPNGVMRVEGEKIISVNNEEQILVISGLVRPRDVNSNNEVMSSKIAYLRVDYFGKGLLGDAQYVGWFGRVVNSLWPF